ncbi:S1 domain-containing RNA-binding protein [Lacticaseibacillus camelliae]|uniref:RNA-binding protein n=1 Tax=Lacticaseibacillus camelliae DSM 22697 = JCM 13995 TaxID=1423730 RepID=A0A0R2FM48_9LACO|nr:S1 domain-containing RNA-binding protein [Lacticaseibacillus camelliae]KRN25962.1 RNA-binding protein [Lacticaseibacillus camelliae DSM 22697 = JCM 13995]
MAIEVGEKLTGKVTGITNFGAFVDLGSGTTGLVHISEISDAYVKDIHDVLSVGDEVTVKVMTIKDGKIGLSIRKAVDKPAGEHAQSSHGGHFNHAPHAESHGERNFNGPRPHSNGGGRGFGHAGKDAPKDDFDSMMSGFLKESESRLSDLRHNTEGKRGGRGGRRS